MLLAVASSSGHHPRYGRAAANRTQSPWLSRAQIGDRRHLACISTDRPGCCCGPIQYKVQSQSGLGNIRKPPSPDRPGHHAVSKSITVALPNGLEAPDRRRLYFPDLFICPLTDQVRATGPTTQAMVRDFQKPAIAGISMSALAGLDTCPFRSSHTKGRAMHGRDGMNVLFGDGHVDAVPTQQPHHRIRELFLGFETAAIGATRDAISRPLMTVATAIDSWYFCPPPGPLRVYDRHCETTPLGALVDEQPVPPLDSKWSRLIQGWHGLLASRGGAQQRSCTRSPPQLAKSQQSGSLPYRWPPVMGRPRRGSAATWR